MLTFNFNPFPEIETERLILRRMNQHDAQSFFDLKTNKKANEYIERDPPADVKEIHTLIEKIDSRIDNNEAISWAISLKGQTEMIGTISFHATQPEHHRAEIGYMLHPDFWRKGYISEAIKAVIDYGFSGMNLHSIEAFINPENTASAKVLEKFNFVREGYYRENYFYNGNFYDTAVYSLLRTSKK